MQASLPDCRVSATSSGFGPVFFRSLCSEYKSCTSASFLSVSSVADLHCLSTSSVLKQTWKTFCKYSKQSPHSPLPATHTQKQTHKTTSFVDQLCNKPNFQARVVTKGNSSEIRCNSCFGKQKPKTKNKTVVSVQEPLKHLTIIYRRHKYCTCMYMHNSNFKTNGCLASLKHVPAPAQSFKTKVFV